MDNIEKIEEEILILVEKYSKIKFRKDKYIPGKDVIQASGKYISEDEIINMVSASLDGWLTAGRFNQEFEKKLSKYIDVKHLMTVNSGSSANLVAFNTLTSPRLGEKAIKKGDEVITVAAGFPTTINPIIQFGAIPVFVDIRQDTLNIDEKLVEKCLSSKTKAVMVAHTLGNPFNLSSIVDFCEKNNLWLIEDCCDALGAKYEGKHVGTFGDIASLSFYPAHHITMGEGGAVFTNSSRLKRIAESYRDWGRDCYCPPGEDNTCNKRYCWKSASIGGSLPVGYDHKYTYSHLGYNLKITDMQAACGLGQINKIEKFIEIRKRNYHLLLKGLREFENHFYFARPTDSSSPSWFGFPITIKNNSKINRSELINYLKENKIGTRLLFAGNVTKQPYFDAIEYRIVGALKNTDKVMRDTFWIGLHQLVGEDSIKYIIKVISNFIKEKIN